VQVRASKTSFRFQLVTTRSVALLLALAAGSSSYAFVSPAAEPSTRVGPLETRLAHIYRLAEEDLSDCEVSRAEIDLRREVVQALDDREQEFDDFNRRGSFRSPTLSANALGDTNIGPLRLVARPERDEKVKSGWSSSVAGWRDFHAELLSLRNTPIDARWTRLLGKVKATLGDDERRAIDGISMSISHQAIEQAIAMRAAIDECLGSKSAGENGATKLDAAKCASLSKPDPFKEALAAGTAIRSAYARYLSATVDSERARILESLYDSLRTTANRFEPMRQTGIRFPDAETLMLSLDPGDLRGYETELGLAIQKYWNVVEGIKLEIEWMTSTRDAPIFRIFFDRAPGTPSYVNWPAREIQIGQGTWESTPARQIGHALGFRDRYLSVWRPDLCKYEDQWNTDDLMSDSRYGAVTKAHWDSLRKAYEKGKTGE
jgi:hypothetical protein